MTINGFHHTGVVTAQRVTGRTAGAQLHRQPVLYLGNAYIKLLGIVDETSPDP